MDERRVQRIRLRDTMSICQNRYLIPSLANKYLKLFDMAKTLYDSVNLTDSIFSQRFEEVVNKLGELEEEARPLLAEPYIESLEQPKKQRGGTRQGAGRPGKGYVRRKTTLSLPPEYWEQFDEMAAHTVSEAALIRSIMISVLDAIAGNVDVIVCPVCNGSCLIQPKSLNTEIVCPGCDGTGKLEQIKLKLE